MAPPASSEVKLTDQGRAVVRRTRMVLMPIRVVLVLALCTWPAGGMRAAWAVPALRVFLVGLVIMVALERAGITADPSARSRDRMSKFLLLLGAFGGLVVGVREVGSGAAFLPALPLLHSDVATVLGAVLWAAGVAMRQWAMRTLGRFFTDKVKIFDDHRLVTSGPYRMVRHPSYLGLALVMVGAPLALGSALATVMCVVLGGLALAFRVSVEEGELRAAFGPVYADYARVTPALLPWPRPSTKAQSPAP